MADVLVRPDLVAGRRQQQDRPAGHYRACRCRRCRPLVSLEKLVEGLLAERAAAGSGDPAGLVTCSINARVSTDVRAARPQSTDQNAWSTDPERVELLLRRQAAKRWLPKFPTPELVGASLEKWQHAPWDGGEGPRPVVEAGPGVFKVRYHDLGKRQRTAERTHRRALLQADMAAKLAAAGFPLPEVAPTGREIVEWSTKSRSRMVEVFAGLDWSPVQHIAWAPAMITLTMPGKWQVVAPDGKAYKHLVRNFEKRWKRAWGFEPIWIWKLEFQRRGAPHHHMFAILPPPSARAGDHRHLTAAEAEMLGLKNRPRVRPAVGDGLPFMEWIKAAWADVVAHPDPEERRKHEAAGVRIDYAEAEALRDPKRMSVYFSKHGSFVDKEYQNVVPKAWRGAGKGPGRFWGSKGLRKATKAVTVQPEAAIWAQRIARRHSRAQGVTRQKTVPRYPGGCKLESKYPDVIGLAGAALVRAYRPRYRKVRRPVRRFAKGFGGYVTVNDGAAFTEAVARGVSIAERPAELRSTVLPWMLVNPAAFPARPRAADLPSTPAQAPRPDDLSPGDRRTLRARARAVRAYRERFPDYEPTYTVAGADIDRQVVELQQRGLFDQHLDVIVTECPAVRFPSVLLPRVSDFDPDRDELARLIRDFER